MRVRDDLKNRKKELLEDHFNYVINKINERYKNELGFILRDLLEDGKTDVYYIYVTKGILLMLLAQDYIKIISTYNGNKNYVYICQKEIKINLN